VGVILDTNALSALAGRDRTLLDRLDSVGMVAVTIINLGEYRFGIGQSRYREELERWLEALLKGVQVLFVDLETTRHYATLRGELRQAGTPIPANDCWIAALVRQHRMPILSRDQHFDRVKGLRRVDW